LKRFDPGTFTVTVFTVLAVPPNRHRDPALQHDSVGERLFGLDLTAQAEAGRGQQREC